MVSATPGPGGSVAIPRTPAQYGSYQVVSAGIQAVSQGGNPAGYQFDLGTFYGVGGNGGPVTVSSQGSIDSATNGYGIYARSLGGSGLASDGYVSQAGAGGTVLVQSQGGTIAMGGADAIGIYAASAITETGGGRFSIGVLAISSGTASVIDPFNSVGSIVSSGLGDSGTVAVENDGAISTQGQLAIGIAAISTPGPPSSPAPRPVARRATARRRCRMTTA
jgi:hypothetical protein